MLPFTNGNSGGSIMAKMSSSRKTDVEKLNASVQFNDTEDTPENMLLFDAMVRVVRGLALSTGLHIDMGNLRCDLSYMDTPLLGLLHFGRHAVIRSFFGTEGDAQSYIEPLGKLKLHHGDVEAICTPEAYATAIREHMVRFRWIGENE